MTLNILLSVQALLFLIAICFMQHLYHKERKEYRQERAQYVDRLMAKDLREYKIETDISPVSPTMSPIKMKMDKFRETDE